MKKSKKKGKGKEEQTPAAEKRPFYDITRGVHRILPIVFLTLAILLGAFLILDLFGANSGPAAWVVSVLKGLFAQSAYGLPFLILYTGLRWRGDIEKERAVSRMVYFTLFILFFQAIIWCFAGPKPLNPDGTAAFGAGACYQSGIDMNGSGFFGGLVGWLLYYFTGYLGVPLLTAMLICLYVFHFLKFTPSRIAESRRARAANGTPPPAATPPAATPPPAEATATPAATPPAPTPPPAAEGNDEPAIEKLSWRQRRKKRRAEKRAAKTAAKSGSFDGYYPETQAEDSFEEIRRQMEKEAAEMGRTAPKGNTPPPADPFDDLTFDQDAPSDPYTAPSSPASAGMTTPPPAGATPSPAVPGAVSADTMFRDFNPLSDTAVINTTSTVVRPVGSPAEARRETVRPVTHGREEYHHIPGGVQGSGEGFGTFRIHPTHNDVRPEKPTATATATPPVVTTIPTPTPPSEKENEPQGKPLEEFEMLTHRPDEATIPPNTLPYVHPATMPSTQPQPTNVPPAGYPYGTMPYGAPPYGAPMYPPMGGYPTGYPAQPYMPYPGYPYPPTPGTPGHPYPTQPAEAPAAPNTPVTTQSAPPTPPAPEKTQEPIIVTKEEPTVKTTPPITPPPAKEPVRETRSKTPTYDNYMFPPLSLLTRAVPITNLNSPQEIEDTSARLVEEFGKFKHTIEVKEVTVGPRITRYCISPPNGVRINTLIGLANDIALGLAVKSIRIDPVPNTPYLGVEIPNRTPATVHLSSLIDTEQFRNSKTETTIPIGSSVTGQPVFADIAKMPHVLIAGATGMGKSVFMNSLLLSLLYRAKPSEVKLILVDPKRVELSMYNGIPHLLIPPVVEPQKAAGALIWAVGEMERRYHLMESVGMRNIEGYNEVVRNDPSKGEPQPKIIIVIDELNDLMMQARDAVEPAIMSIAQKARAAGIHLILGTQRPSVDVITGVIKANIPSRIAFHVSSGTDSRTILDFYGAEKLLNNGDMLSAIAGAEPIRVQGAFVSDAEVLNVTNYLKQNYGGNVYDEIVSAQIESETEKYRNSGKRQSDRDMDDEDLDGSIFEDSKFMEACRVALESGKISTSLLQRRCSIGYGKAAKYIDIMQSMGIVSPPDGQKPREVLMSRDQFEEMVASEIHYDD